MSAAPAASPRTLLIGVGAPKAGTSWLANYLKQHPDVFMSPIKELHFWNTLKLKDTNAVNRRLRKTLARLDATGSEIARWNPNIRRRDVEERLAMNGSVEAYLDFFRARANGEPVWCEISPAYATLDRRVFGAMAAIADDVRFVLLMRNPAERYWSYLDFIRRAKPEMDLAEAFRSCLTDPAFVWRGDYRRTIQELHAAVDPARVHLAFFERLFTQGEVDRFCDFLEVGQFAATFDPVGASRNRDEMSEDMRAEAVVHFGPVYRYVNALFEGDVPESWKSDMAAHLA